MKTRSVRPKPPKDKRPPIFLAGEDPVTTVARSRLLQKQNWKCAGCFRVVSADMQLQNECVVCAGCARRQERA